MIRNVVVKSIENAFGENIYLLDASLEERDSLMMSVCFYTVVRQHRIKKYNLLLRCIKISI